MRGTTMGRARSYIAWSLYGAVAICLLIPPFPLGQDDRTGWTVWALVGLVPVAALQLWLTIFWQTRPPRWLPAITYVFSLALWA